MIEDAVSQLRAKLSGAVAARSSQESFETRLTLACLRGRGHLLLTGSDRGEIDDLLMRVIEKVAPMAVVKARASDPATGIDDVFALVAKDSKPKGYVERQRALAELVNRAEAADKTVLVLVDDADAATIEQLEHLRDSLEITPEALKYLRLVLIGNSGLVAKLHTQTGRPLSARIASHVRLDEPQAQAETTAAPARTPVISASRSYALTLAAATCVAFSSYVYVSALLSGGSHARHGRGVSATANVKSREFAIAAGAMAADPSAADATLANAAAATVPAVSTPSATAEPAPMETASATPPARAKAPAGKKPTPTAKGGSSISSLLKRFR